MDLTNKDQKSYNSRVTRSHTNKRKTTDIQNHLFFDDDGSVVNNNKKYYLYTVKKNVRSTTPVILFWDSPGFFKKKRHLPSEKITGL